MKTYRMKLEAFVYFSVEAESEGDARNRSEVFMDAFRRFEGIDLDDFYVDLIDDCPARDIVLYGDDAKNLEVVRVEDPETA